MIKMQSGSILLQTPTGEQEFLDLDLLHDDLWASCLEAGVEDSEMPDDIISVITGFVGRGSVLSSEEVNSLVLQMLCDSGLHDLADAFAQRRHAISTVLSTEEIITPDHEQILAILRNQPFFLAKPVDQIATMVESQLDQLKFTECSRRFVIELARNSWHNLQSSQFASASGTYWLIHRREFAGLLPPSLTALLYADVVDIRSVSSLLPAVRGHVDLSLLARQLGPGLLPELQFCPAVENIANLLQEAHEAITREAATREAGVDVPLPGEIHFVELKTLVAEHLGGSLREEKILRASLQSSISDKFRNSPLKTLLV